jgi:two-component system response regulator LytT
LYIESKLHKLEFHVMEGDLKAYTMYGTLNALEQELEEHGFVRIHQSYLVNIKYIKNVVRYKAILVNGDELAIPKARYAHVKSQLTEEQGQS